MKQNKNNPLLELKEGEYQIKCLQDMHTHTQEELCSIYLPNVSLLTSSNDTIFANQREAMT